jgi:hypothetical protein
MTIGIIVSKCRAEIMQGRNKELVRFKTEMLNKLKHTVKVYFD